MIMSLFRRTPKNRNRQIVDSVHAAITDAARQPVLFSDWGIPDTPIGRYESISLHMILFLHRTREGEDALSGLSQDVLDQFFRDVDHSIRELGVGDPGVPKRMKKLARMFYGRMGNYWQALDDNDSSAFAETVSRNIAAHDANAVAAGEIASYALRVRDHFASQTDADILAGKLSFPAAFAGER
ncbi:ubiquinol-cytochrome C chaperone family protein [Oricola sp.]|uniref:ubiquinol-cytochrome C chaperone family protein n=1 Tax=Oricola sp. TaxID=1979950 RepID=UPI003BA8B8D9